MSCWSSAASTRGGRPSRSSRVLPCPLARFVCIELLALSGNCSVDRVIKLDVIMFQSRPRCANKFNPGLLIDSHGSHKVQLCQRKIPLCGQCLEARSGPKFLLFLGDIESLNSQITSFLG